jgi:hypothetical protein
VELVLTVSQLAGLAVANVKGMLVALLVVRVTVVCGLGPEELSVVTE